MNAQFRILLLTIITFTPASALAVGALAIDGNQGGQYGFSYDYDNVADAKNRALRECGSGCYIVQVFETGCAAYAADQAQGSTAYGWGKASTSNEAKTIALSYCREYGGRNCIVRVWGCNSK
ncbi:DUF4189 domain-containing protein [Alteromonas aestuariivivens]|uniref:DUF4189 domain-containing protein n=2 Tax=Alteromonas aestuariivivens TaxID=1938339 RepID=A0A3D8M7V6_9ALTE|nr:DUF4189 domain-containing protein [Alteromonas aestuariivivens]